MTKLEPDEAVIGTVDRIVGTSVFVRIESQHQCESCEGVISFSEVAPGRIRNIRDYVNPNQKIVVKILRIDKEGKHIDLSLRRVTQKEKKEVLERENKEKELFTLLKIVLKQDDKAKEIFQKIRDTINIQEFFEKHTADDISLIKNFGLNEKEAIELSSMLKDKIKEKKAVVKADFSLYSKEEGGLEKIKKVLSLADLKDEGQKPIIKYFGSPHYSISVEDKDYKEANKRMKEALISIEQKARAENCFFETLPSK